MSTLEGNPPSAETGSATALCDRKHAENAAGSPSALTDHLTDSLELLAAIERIEIVECHTLPHGTYDVTGELLPTHCCTGAHEDDYPPCVEVYALEVPLDSVSREIVYARTAEDAAIELLIRCTDDQCQDTSSVRWCMAMIERRFARARERAVGGAHAAD